MPGIIINNIKYIRLFNNNEFKKKSLYDNVYFTLRDIFANCESLDTAMEANSYNSKLTNNISFEERNENFNYSNILNDKNYVESLIDWLRSTLKNEYDFQFEEPEDDDFTSIEEIDEKKFIKFDDWFNQFNELGNLLKEHNKNLIYKNKLIPNNLL